MQHRKNSPNTLVILVFGLLLNFLGFLPHSLTAQIKKFEKIEKKQRNTFNFEADVQPRVRQKKDKRLYQVYSDRSDNIVYLDPYAQKKGEQQDMLAPYYVLDQKNDYLKVVTANPELIGKPKGLFSIFFGKKYRFKDHKKTEYIGWIHKDNVLHYDHPRVSEFNYKPLRYVVGIQDLKTLYNIKRHVKQDSVYVFKDPLFKEKSEKKLLLDQFVYLYKYDSKKKAALVANQSTLKPEDSVSRIMGWIPQPLLKLVGQQQVYTMEKSDSLIFHKSQGTTKDTLHTREIGSDYIYDLSKQKVRMQQAADTTQVVVPVNVWDHYDNTLINVDGEDVLIRKLDEIREDNKIVNFHFIFDCSKELRKKQLRLMSSLQRIWVLLSSEERYADYEYSFSASSYGCGKFYALPKTKSFSLWVDYLQNIFLDTNLYEATQINTNGIEQCFEYAIADEPKGSFVNNIIMVAGEKKFYNPPNIKEITRKLGQTSSRIIFYQLENKPDDQHQDYILQAKRILGRVSQSHSDFIRAFIVENDLIKSENTFTSIPAVDNIYVYDAPNNSTYQGGITFPKINKVLLATSFDKALDSVLRKTIRFNSTFTGSLEYHAKKLGFLRSKSGQRIKQLILNDTTYNNSLGMVPRNYMYEKYYQDERFNQGDNNATIFGYLLTKEELEMIIDNYNSLIPMYTKEVKRKDRRRLYRVYRKNSRNINNDVFRKILKRKNHIADLVFLKTGIPVRDTYLRETKIKHLKRKRRTSHQAFTELMIELRKKVEVLEGMLSRKNATIYTHSDTRKYYFVSENYIL
ncbi:type VI secretion system protein TssR domain-containing protein [Aquimarina sp. 2-A2]|uniref:type VI secretion system protein TssR domain-containing protein n=1 Tax=Aquimarina sp. 2-A2 TaxID=3382644 RepID=UPI00387F1201